MFHNFLRQYLSEDNKQLLKYIGIAFVVIAYLVLVEGGAPPVIFDLDFPALRIPASWSLP